MTARLTQYVLILSITVLFALFAVGEIQTLLEIKLNGLFDSLKINN